MPTRRLKILVGGAGVAGLATAAFLAKRGHEVVVLEAAAVPRPVGAGLLLQPPAIAMLDCIGAAEPIRASASPIHRLLAKTRRGRLLLDVSYAELGPDIHGMGVRRPVLWDALHRAALEEGARIEADCRIVGLASTPDVGGVCLKGGAQLDADLVVLASGAHTALRPGAGKHVSNLYPWGCLWATIELTPEWPDSMLLQRCAGSHHMAGVLPTGLDAEGRRTAAFYWSVRNDRVESFRAAPIADWHAEVAGLWPDALPLVAPLAHADIVHAAYRDVWADPPHGGCTVAVGDAAHGTSPQLGQGATQALRDAETLARALEGEGSVADRLVGYWKLRRQRTAFYRTASRLLTPFFQTSTPGPGLLRDLVAGPFGRIPLVRREAALALAGLKTGMTGADQWPPLPVSRIPILLVGETSPRQGE